jgi:hypothetical protein
LHFRWVDLLGYGIQGQAYNPCSAERKNIAQIMRCVRNQCQGVRRDNEIQANPDGERSSKVVGRMAMGARRSTLSTPF